MEVYVKTKNDPVKKNFGCATGLTIKFSNKNVFYNDQKVVKNIKNESFSNVAVT